MISDCEEISRRSPLPVSWSDLRPVRARLEGLYTERKNPPTVSDADVELFRILAVPEPASEHARRLGISTSELMNRVDGAISRLETAQRATAGRLRAEVAQTERLRDPDRL